MRGGAFHHWFFEGTICKTTRVWLLWGEGAGRTGVPGSPELSVGGLEGAELGDRTWQGQG